MAGKESKKLPDAEILSRVAHELRNPLSGILNAVILAEESPSPLSPEDFRRVVEIAARGMRRIVDDLEAYDKVTIQPREFSLREVVEDVMALAGESAVAHGVVLADVITPDVPTFVVSDPDRLQQILLNLISNGIKFAPRGRVLVRCAMGPEGRLLFSVEDDGIGIAVADQGQLFQPFSRVGRRAAHTPGVGLGLAISRRLARALGGDMEVASREGHGSRFSFSIRPESSRLYEAPDREDTDGRRFLCYSDTPSATEILRQQLEARGLTVEEWQPGTAVEPADGLVVYALSRESAIDPGMVESLTRQFAPGTTVVFTARAGENPDVTYQRPILRHGELLRTLLKRRAR